MQSDRDIVVLIRCSIHFLSVLVGYGSNIIAHIIYDNTVSDRPMELKIAKSSRTSRLFCIKMMQSITLVRLNFYVRSNISSNATDAMKHMKSFNDKEFGTCYCKFASNRKSSKLDHCIENRIESKRHCIVAPLLVI
jgi:hypothetical protein